MISKNPIGQTSHSASKINRAKPQSKATPAKTASPKAPKDGLSDDMRTMLEDLRNPAPESSLTVDPKGQISLKQEAQTPSIPEAKGESVELQSKPKTKEPKSQGMREMLENIESPQGSPRVMVDERGLLVFGSSDERELQGLPEAKAKPEASQARTGHESSVTNGNWADLGFGNSRLGEISRSYLGANAIGGAALGAMVGMIGFGAPGTSMLGLAAISAGIPGIGFVAGAKNGPGFPQLSHPQSRAENIQKPVDKASPEPSKSNVKTPREGSDMADMLANISNPKEESAVGVDSKGNIAMLSQPFQSSTAEKAGSKRTVEAGPISGPFEGVVLSQGSPGSFSKELAEQQRVPERTSGSLDGVVFPRGSGSENTNEPTIGSVARPPKQIGSLAGSPDGPGFPNL